MLKPLDRCRRDSTLLQFTSKRLRDYVDPTICQRGLLQRLSKGSPRSS